MNVSETNVTTADDPLRPIAIALASAPDSVESLKVATDGLLHLAESAGDASRDELQRCAVLFANLLTIASDARQDESSGVADEAGPIVDFVRERLDVLRVAFHEDDFADIDRVVSEASERWREWMDLVDDSAWPPANASPDWDDTLEPSPVDTESSEVEDAEVPIHEPSESEVHSLLSAIQSQLATHPSISVGRAESNAPLDEAPSDTAFHDEVESSRSSQIGGELLDAFRDDANRCLSAMEQAALAFEANPSDPRPLDCICRELHTLKGASGSVGWTSLAAYLHEVEDAMRPSGDGGQVRADAQSILTTVDTVRSRVTQIANPQCKAPQHADLRPSVSTSGPAVPLDQAPSDGEETIRVKAAQLDRLLDLLAQLVMLRNRRDSGVDQLKSTHADLVGCVTRLRSLNDGTVTQDSGSPGLRFPLTSPGSNSLTEVANDVLEVAQGLRELYEPVAEENLEVSRLIREFRQELMQLCRLPISGLFQRLQRAVRDAARVEGKRVGVQQVGESLCLDRSLQERLFEPLLHIVRNAVSHGIESESQRTAAGKEPVGTVTIEARGGASQLVVEVRDDGAGLDYEALRRRGLELGLLTNDRPVSHHELAQLIFHPGFSTRRTAGEVAGRGVGMDVVATTLERMRSWVEVESDSGHGTRIRLTVPLRSVIEHSMVFRSCGQLFAVPLRCVHSAGDWNANSDSASSFGPRPRAKPAIYLSDLLDLKPVQRCESPQALRLDDNRRTTGENDTLVEPATLSAEERQQVILVDEILGPEEVVVRPLPPLLRRQPFFSGVTLAGTGEIVLLLDGQRLCERAANWDHAPTDGERSAISEAQPRSQPNTVLVVDDSLSARRVLARALEGRQFRVTEATNGFEAMERVRDQRPTMIFTDLEMPRRSGFDLLQELKSDANTASIPVVMISSRQEDDIRARARELGASAYLTKPFREQELFETLEQINATEPEP